MADAPGLDDGERVDAVAATRLDAASDDTFDVFARLVRRFLDVPVALVSLVDDRRQFFPGAAGLAEPLATDRQTPLSHSFCKTVVVSSDELVVTDARTDPRVAGNPAIEEIGVVAYAGMPLRDASGRVLGSLCAIDHEPRSWTASELDTLRDLAEACAAELRGRIAADLSASSAGLAVEQRRIAESASAESDRLREAAEHARRDAEDARADAELAQDAAVAASERLQLLAVITRATGTTFDADEAMRRLARLVVPSVADWTVIDRVDADGEVFRVAFQHDGDGQDVAQVALGRLPSERAEGTHGGSLGQVLAGSGRVRVTADDLGSTRFDALGRAQAELFERFGLADAVVLPIRTRGDLLGAITLVRTDDVFSEGDLLLADEIAVRASLALDNARLYEQQHHVAETMQRSLLTYLPEPDHLQIAARYLPATAGIQVGGDWYDAFITPDGATTIVVGDVLGHDLDAAALMAQVRNALRAIAVDRDVPPAELMTRFDVAADVLRLDALATAVVGRLTQSPEQAERGARTFEWTNAGHPPPHLVHADGSVTSLEESADLMLGVDPRSARRDHAVDLSSGDTLWLFTDGLVERSDLTIDHGLARLRQVLTSTADLPLEAACDEVIARLVPDAQPDDVVILALRVFDESRPRPAEAGVAHL